MIIPTVAMPMDPSVFLLPGVSMTTTHTPKRSSHKMRLAVNFEPGEYSVICGRGKQHSGSPGNKYLRSLVHKNLEAYSMAKNKPEKSAIVSRIIETVREASPQGAFVKQDETTGIWWEVDDSFAREKIGCIFRDLLHKQYRSSTKSKQARKKRKEEVSEHSSTSTRNVPLDQSSTATNKDSSVNKKTVTSLEPLPLFENDRPFDTHMIAPIPLRPHDPVPVEALSSNNRSLKGVGGDPFCFGRRIHRPLRYDIQQENLLLPPMVPSATFSSSVTSCCSGVQEKNRNTALSLALKDALCLLNALDDANNDDQTNL